MRKKRNQQCYFPYKSINKLSPVSMLFWKLREKEILFIYNFSQGSRWFLAQGTYESISNKIQGIVGLGELLHLLTPYLKDKVNP